SRLLQHDRSDERDEEAADGRRPLPDSDRRLLIVVVQPVGAQEVGGQLGAPLCGDDPAIGANQSPWSAVDAAPAATDAIAAGHDLVRLEASAVPDGGELFGEVECLDVVLLQVTFPGVGEDLPRPGLRAEEVPAEEGAVTARAVAVLRADLDVAGVEAGDPDRLGPAEAQISELEDRHPVRHAPYLSA